MEMSLFSSGLLQASSRGFWSAKTIKARAASSGRRGLARS
ncbi:hypothetical protein HMPREF3227_01292 [Corynebacterium sp. CMW7794]|nr:hypothetical protein HMPREF0307_02305 [Corynebacterium sp. DNF00584]KXI17926.1 hypothetical protein HMPREF3227_01292 [Corynebacterium sp. CMW7794]